MDTVSRAREIIDIEMQGLRSARDGLDASFDDAVRLLLDTLSAGCKIVVTGIGKSLHIADKIAATLASTGSPSITLNPAQAMHGDLGVLSENDALLVLSFSGESDEILSLLPFARRIGARIIALTGKPDSALGRASDVTIAIQVEREACPFNMAPTASTTATLAIGDALAMTVLEARGFRREDYAQLHPGGAIGRALLLRVGDIMRTGDRVATVPASATVQDAVLAMSGARAGSACVTAANGRLLGILTDGDLRRHLPRSAGLLQQPIAEVMTPSPLSIRRDQLAADALRVFETHAIDDLPVLDDQDRLVGCVDIQDLPKLKIL